jgi:hypothetical protein
MKRSLPVALIVALIGAVVAVVAIGSANDDGSGDSVSNTGPIEIDGTSGKDRKIAANLRAYLKPCPGAADKAASIIRRALDKKPGSKDERRIARKYGSVKAFIEYQKRTCASPQRISVQGAVITLTTNLGRADVESANQLCEQIQGSDVADFTPGHTVLGEEDELLARCDPR